MGYRFKKSLIADECRGPDVARARRDWIRHRLPAMRAQPRRRVFIDETSVRTNMAPLRGRAPKGQRLNASTPFGRWRSQTFIAGLTMEALIAPWIIEGALNGEIFATWDETRLAPALEPGGVVILDNLSVHRNARAARA